MDAGAKRSGRRVEELEIITRFVATVTEDPGATIEFFRAQVTMYGASPIYQRVMTELGYGQEVEKILEGYQQWDRKSILAAVPEEMVGRFYAWGTEEECRAKVREFYRAGVGTVVVAPLSYDAGEIQRTCEAFLPEEMGQES